MKKSKLLMIVGSLLLLGLFVFPLWNITLEAPQYPIPLGMNIHINKFTDVHEFDIKNINLMNHYVGMQYIPETIPEFKIFPIVIGAMVLLGVLVGFLGNYKWFLAWFVLMSLLGIAGIYDFYLWEYDYGHNLDPKAIMNFKNPDGSPMGFQPPLLGTKHILNFIAHSYPRTGAYMMLVGMLMTLAAFFVGKKEAAAE
jgi:hypothetical protein